MFFLAVWLPSSSFVGFGFSMTIQRKAAEETIAVVGADAAAPFLSYLDAQEVVFESFETIDAGLERYDALLAFAPDFAARLEAGDMASVEIVVGETGPTAVAKRSRLRELLDAFGGIVARDRLAARGLPEQLVDPLAIDVVDRTDAANPLIAAIGPLLGFLLFAGAFFGGLSFVVDSVAGERERKSLEPLVVQPVAPWEIVVGKWIFLACVTVAVLFIETLTLSIAFQVVDRVADLPFDVALSLPAMAMALIATLPVALFGPAFLLTLSMNAKNLKEAQAMVGFGLIVPMAVAGASAFAGFGERAAFAPVVSDIGRIGRALTGQGLDLATWAVATCGHLALVAGLLAIASVLLPAAARR